MYTLSYPSMLSVEPETPFSLVTAITNPNFKRCDHQKNEPRGGRTVNSLKCVEKLVRGNFGEISGKVRRGSKHVPVPSESKQRSCTPKSSSLPEEAKEASAYQGNFLFELLCYCTIVVHDQPNNIPLSHPNPAGRISPQRFTCLANVKTSVLCCNALDCTLPD